MLGRLLRLIWGDDVDPGLRPVLIVGFAGSIAAALSAATGYGGGHISDGIWAIDELDASSAQLGLYFERLGRRHRRRREQRGEEEQRDRVPEVLTSAQVRGTSETAVQPNRITGRRPRWSSTRRS